MPSPTRPLRGSPPRRALHERSESQVNERSLRMVGDPQAPVYGNPYPTKPSQILSPKNYNAQGSASGAEPGVSYGRNQQGETEQDIEGSPTLSNFPKHEDNAGIKQFDNVSSRRQSSTDVSFYTPATNTPGMATSTSFLTMDEPVEEEGRMSDDIVQLPSVPFKTGPPEVFRSNSPEVSEHQPVQTKDSESSLSSTNSTGTVIVKKHREGKKRASYSAFPSVARPSSSKSSLSLSTPQKIISREPSGQQQSVSPVSPVSPGSPVSPSFAATSSERRISSTPVYSNLQQASQSSLNLQYPIIRPPSASASWVEPPTSAPQRPQRATERNNERWNPHLSTVPSEGTGSQSEGRSSQGMWLPDSSRVSKSSSMGLNGRGSSDLPARFSPPMGESSSDVPPVPSPPPVHRRDLTGSTIRVVTEQEDAVPKLQPIPGSRGSEHLSTPFAAHQKRNSMIARPSSRASFFRDSIPAWAKAYYARPQSSSSVLKADRHSRPSTSTENVSLNIFRPRTRNDREANAEPRRDSLAIGPVRPRELDLSEIRGPPRHKVTPSWSPHLWHDKTSLGRRRTIFQAPSIDEQAEGKSPSRRNVQILLFVIGFIFPIGWFIASFLPLPPRPNISSVKGKNNPTRSQIMDDLEKQLGPIDEARYENARWWRNINRIMSLAGIVIVVAVITIAAVTAK